MTITAIVMRYWLFVVGFLALMIAGMFETQCEIKAKRHKLILKNRREYYTPSPDWEVSS